MRAGPHGIEGVSRVPCSRRDPRASSVDLGVGVAEAYADTALGRFRNDLDSTIKFRGDGYYFDMAARCLP